MVNFFLHLDQHLNVLIQQYGAATYAILFLIIFVETGLVVIPFLPGDSLLFIAGTFASQGSLNVVALFLILVTAAIAGDTMNYWIGRAIGMRAFNKENRLLFNRKNYDRAHHFYEEYGSKAIIIARFLPVLRAWAPFVAGIGHMEYRRFIFFNVVGGILWTAVAIFAGFFFGQIPVVKENFSLVILGVVIVSIIPIIFEGIRVKKRRAK